MGEKQRTNWSRNLTNERIPVTEGVLFHCLRSFVKNLTNERMPVTEAGLKAVATASCPACVYSVCFA